MLTSEEEKYLQIRERLETENLTPSEYEKLEKEMLNLEFYVSTKIKRGI